MEDPQSLIGRELLEVAVDPALPPGVIAVQARELGLVIPFPLTAGEWQRCAYHPPGVQGLLFDDLDRIIQGLSTVPVIAATWTAEEQP